MTTLKEGLPPLPPRLSGLPISPDGYPVPWFVAYVNGVPDFRCSDARKLVVAVSEDRCWMCGERNGAYKIFAIGPMCAVNRVTAEPPCHLECAEYAVRACPWLMSPRRRRREKDLPEEHDGCAGEMIKRNPGVTLLWATKKFKPFRAGGGGTGILFRLGDPVNLGWWCRGRTATREELVDAIESGMPILREVAASDPPGSVEELERMYQAALRLVPAA